MPLVLRLVLFFRKFFVFCKLNGFLKNSFFCPSRTTCKSVCISGYPLYNLSAFDTGEYACLNSWFNALFLELTLKSLAISIYPLCFLPLNLFNKLEAFDPVPYVASVIVPSILGLTSDTSIGASTHSLVVLSICSSVSLVVADLLFAYSGLVTQSSTFLASCANSVWLNSLVPSLSNLLFHHSLFVVEFPLLENLFVFPIGKALPPLIIAPSAPAPAAPKINSVLKASCLYCFAQGAVATPFVHCIFGLFPLLT